MTAAPSSVRVWFGVLGGPLAWATQFVLNIGINYFNCSLHGRWGLPAHSLQIGLGLGGLLVCAISTAVAFALFRSTARDRSLALKVVRGFGGEPPPGRVHFLAIIGLLVNFLAISIIVMTTVGAPILLPCRQS